MGKDNLYSTPQDAIKQFAFDEAVTRVFNDMIHRSVPGYEDVIRMIGVLADRYIQPQTNCYDLGASLGAATLSMAKTAKERGASIKAIDNSEAMCRKCQENVGSISKSLPVEVVCSDIVEASIENASMVVLNYTLQFVEPPKRLGVLEKICQGLVPGGILITSEKAAFEDPEEAASQEKLHHAFKELNGYTQLEISQKRTALEKVLIPETLQVHQERLKQAGFRQSTVWFRCFNFVSILSFK